MKKGENLRFFMILRLQDKPGPAGTALDRGSFGLTRPSRDCSLRRATLPDKPSFCGGLLRISEKCEKESAGKDGGIALFLRS